MTDDVLPLTSILTVTPEPGSGHRFTAPNLPLLSDRIYGGQILAQSLAAAGQTLPDDRPAHSLHAYFIRGGIPGTPLEYQVDNLSDGRTLAHRRVQALQTERTLFSSIISFASNEDGKEHQGAGPVVPGPDEVAPSDDLVMLPVAELGGFELRPIVGDDAAQLGGDELGRRAFWIKLRGQGPDDPAWHQQALAYTSDLAMFATSMKVHGVQMGGGGGRGTLITSLDHALWWHAPARMDEWHLLVQEAPQARSGRSLNAAYYYSTAGQLVASVAQETLFRIAPPEA